MNAREGRSLPAWLADIVQDFELYGRRLVTVDDVQHVRPELNRALSRQALAELARRGWLVPIGVRGTYEFIPGAAAGVYPSGDPWLVLRAELDRRPDAFHVGATSAAWLRGYAQRRPPKHIVVTTPSVRVPSPLSTAYKVLRTNPAPAHDRIEGLPVPTAPELVAEVAQLAPRLALDSAQGWLRRLFADAMPEDVARVLRDRKPAARARAGYLAEVCGADAHAEAIADLGPIGPGPYFTGPRTSGATFSSRWRIYDTGRVAPS
jgi:predicted transcriptional regulator of viral defense system